MVSGRHDQVKTVGTAPLKRSLPVFHHFLEDPEAELLHGVVDEPFLLVTPVC